MPDKIDGEKERKVFVPVTGKDVPIYTIGYSRKDYENIIESNKAEKEEYENNKNESNVRLVDSKLVVAAIKEHTSEEKGLEDVLEKLNVDADSDVRGLIEMTWNNVSAGLEKAKKQQSEIEQVTADREQRMKDGESDGVEEQEKIADIVASRKKTLEQVEDTKQRPQEDVDKLTEEIANNEATIVAAQANIDGAEAQTNILFNNQNTIQQNKEYYNNEYGGSDYIQTLVEEIKKDNILDTAAESHKASTASQMAKVLMPSIRNAQENGKYSCVYSTLTKIQIYILFTFGYVVSTRPSKFDKKGKLTLKDSEGVDYIVSWSHLIEDIDVVE